jgi:hypothetical protein
MVMGDNFKLSMTAGEGVGAEARFERLSTGVGEVSVEAE